MVNLLAAMRWSTRVLRLKMLLTSIHHSPQLVPRYLIPKPVDVKAAIAWGAVLGVGALWMVQVGLLAACPCAKHTSPQPFDWIKAQLNPPKDE